MEKQVQEVGRDSGACTVTVDGGRSRCGIATSTAERRLWGVDIL